MDPQTISFEPLSQVAMAALPSEEVLAAFCKAENIRKTHKGQFIVDVLREELLKGTFTNAEINIMIIYGFSWAAK